MDANTAICTAFGLIVSTAIVAAVYDLCDVPISIMSHIRSSIKSYSKAKYRSRRVRHFAAIIDRDPLFNISSYMYAYSNIGPPKFNRIDFRYALCMYRKYLDRDLIRAIRIESLKYVNLHSNIYDATYDEMAMPYAGRLSFSDTFIDNDFLWSCVPDAHLSTSTEKFQRRLKMLDDIKQQPVRRFRRKLLYLAIVLGCDTPIVGAIDYHTISSILPDKS